MQRYEPVMLLGLGGQFVPAPHAVSIPIKSDWFYDPDDPYAVRMAIWTGTDESVVWVFARNLLSFGMLPGGDTRKEFPTSDVQVYREGSLVVIELTSPSGHAVLKFSHEALNTFLLNTTFSVPFDEESGDPENIEAELQSIIKEANNDF